MIRKALNSHILILFIALTSLLYGSVNNEIEKEVLSKSSNTIVNIEPEEEYEKRRYILTKNYGLAPRVLSDIDSNRPKENHEWIKSLIIKYPQFYNIEDTEAGQT